ncbi:hypothetical protein [Actinopolymorpha sp. B9G3]|uniref:hypothetical protein n=1 Tax=Actinopolymorpha sp. B9G3 TaxID=3158970 RepID=UPI0032D90769
MYQQRYYLTHPERFGDLVLHHAIPQKYWKPTNPCHGVLPPGLLHSLDNLRGVIKGGARGAPRRNWVINNRFHLSLIEMMWNAFDAEFIVGGRCRATPEDFYRQRNLIDQAWSWFFIETSYKLPPEEREVRFQSLKTIGEGAFGQPHQVPGERATAVAANHAKAFFDSAKAGGIDFSTLELRYLALDQKSGDVGIDYAFRVSPGRGSADLADGLENAAEASDAFFVWLALPRTAFWVNLKPNEPDKIMDAQLARTKVGQVMLEADLTLKQQASWALHPKRKLGARFWREAGRDCVPGTRLWITPDIAQVYEKGNELYILEAPLDVKVEQWNYQPTAGDPQIPGGGTSCPGMSEAEKKTVFDVYGQVVLPHLKKEVNTAPEFAALRRIYLSRIAAEWYRERAADGDTSFAGLVESGNIDRWADAGRWRPEQTFKRYVKSFTKGEFRATESWTEGNVEKTWTIQAGGVDFALVPTKSVGSRAFEDRWPGLDALARQGVAGSAVDKSTGNRWLGGHSAVDRAALAREFPLDDEPAARPENQTLSDRARSAAPYLVAVLVLASLSLVALAVLHARRSRQGGTH